MPESRSHKVTANCIAKKYSADYNENQGVDINTPKIVVEVETPENVNDGKRQLQGYKKPAYIAGTSQKAVKEALEKTKGTTIGVMDPKGNIVKKSARKRK